MNTTEESSGRRAAPRAAGNDEGLEQALYEVRRKIHPRSVSGVFARWRVVLVLLTQAIFYGLPWLTWNDRQAVLFDLGARKFYLFGMVLWPQDIIYLTLLLILSALALFLFTAVAGRLFCGYACPQTVYTEIFMWIERLAEGDRFARIRLEAAPWTFDKIRRKAVKHALWLVVAVWTGLTFIGYFSPIRELAGQVWQGDLGPWQWFWLVFYSFATWGNAGFMREQVCRYMCPYARFQSVMVDPDTYVVTYDGGRGEPRGSRSRKTDPRSVGLGDCVNCSICVQVCPTGIDIRDGLQYECIGCGLCIDACDQVMDKMQYPRGLIRYTSERAIELRLTPSQARRRLVRPRVLIYSAIWLALAAAFVGLLATREPLRMDVIRDRSVLAREVEGGMIENVYQLQLMNVTEQAQHLRLDVQGLPELRAQGLDGSVGIELAPASNRLVPIRVSLPVGQAQPGTHRIEFVVHADGNGGKPTVLQEKSSFIVP
ncbi:Ubp3 associated protein Bre5 [Pigmentiphaga humi]|uniref:Ubp3 associated protein Bre5 n=1 Tax=Pigmentiphaga humi TaxID=2478468 RepID=A0A3P4AY71_9BURK|nr:cytochrome c oxidase accessory protein CcoG [Pigmentiphaga humi]VCU68370.1 Ubp3 associated protein Bre5 [Pigmentiphaga humi]